MYSRTEITDIFMSCRTVAEANKAWKAFRLLLVYHAHPQLHFIERTYRDRKAVLSFGKLR